MTIVKEEEQPEEDDCLCKFGGAITPVWLVFCASQFYWDFNSNDNILGGGTPSVRGVIIMDEDNEIVQKKPIKEEEPEDDDYLCKDALAPHTTLRVYSHHPVCSLQCARI